MSTSQHMMEGNPAPCPALSRRGGVGGQRRETRTCRHDLARHGGRDSSSLPPEMGIQPADGLRAETANKEGCPVRDILLL